MVITLATTISTTAGVATRAPKVVRRRLARSLFLTLATFADICWTAISIGVEKKSSQFCAKPTVAPTIEYVAIPAGSLSAPPEINPGPMVRRMSPKLRRSLVASRADIEAVRLARGPLRTISAMLTTRRIELRRYSDRPFAARVFLEQLAHSKGG